MSQNYIFDLVPSPKDGRDWIFEGLRNVRYRTNRAPLPEELDLRNRLTKPRNQGKRGTCAAFSAACIKEYQEREDIGYLGYMSPESVYFYRSIPEGMHLRDVMQILQNRGIAPELYFPYNSSNNPTEIPITAAKMMDNYRISNYSRVTTIQGAKQALFNYGPLLIAFPVYNTGPEIWKSHNKDETFKGGHAMTVVGYNKTGFIIRNSWGDKWNGNGYTIFPYTDWGKQWEIWSTIDDKSPKMSQVYKFVTAVWPPKICC